MDADDLSVFVRGGGQNSAVVAADVQALKSCPVALNQEGIGAGGTDDGDSAWIGCSDGHIDSIDFDSIAGEWYLSMTVESSHSERLSVSVTHGYPSSYDGENACYQTAQAFLPAVQDVILAVVTHEDFERLVRGPE